MFTFSYFIIFKRKRKNFRWYVFVPLMNFLVLNWFFTYFWAFLFCIACNYVGCIFYCSNIFLCVIRKRCWSVSRSLVENNLWKLWVQFKLFFFKRFSKNTFKKFHVGKLWSPCGGKKSMLVIKDSLTLCSMTISKGL